MELTQSIDLPLLRPQQVSDLTAEKASLEASLRNPEIQDKNLVRQQLRRVTQQLDTYTPREAKGEEADFLVSEEKKLREEITSGMLTQEEMRTAPAGSIGYHMEWEKHNKEKILKWKNIRLRLFSGSTDPDIANLERFRPRLGNVTSGGNPLVSRTGYFMPAGDIKIRNVMSDADKRELGIKTSDSGLDLESSEKKKSSKKKSSGKKSSKGDPSEESTSEE